MGPGGKEGFYTLQDTTTVIQAGRLDNIGFAFGWAKRLRFVNTMPPKRIEETLAKAGETLERAREVLVPLRLETQEIKDRLRWKKFKRRGKMVVSGEMAGVWKNGYAGEHDGP
jgi:hypothetical protein